MVQPRGISFSCKHTASYITPAHAQLLSMLLRFAPLRCAATTTAEKFNLPSGMATGGDFDEGGVKRCDEVGASDNCNGTDVPGSDSSEEGRATSGSDNSFVLNVSASILQIGRDNVLNFRSVDDPIPSENPSKVKSGDEGSPVLRELCKPRGLLSVGRSRLGFPDCHYDHLVQLLVSKNQHTLEALDIAGNYEVTVAVSYDGAGGSSLESVPDCQYKRIKSETESDSNATMIGVIGYLFRFHEPDTKYKISFSLNAIPPKTSGRKKTKKHTPCETISEISVTLETGPVASSKSGKTGRKATVSALSPLFALMNPPSLSKESITLYKRSWWVVNQLQSRIDKANYEGCDKYASGLLLKFTDVDTQIAVKLSQSVGACYGQNGPDRALQLIDEAFNFMSEAKNPQLLAGRGYGYRAGIFRRQGDLGKAEHYVQLAEQNITACQTTLDTSFIAYERASMLMDFIACTPHRSLKLVNEARRILEKCIDVCRRVETENSQLSVMKRHFLVLVYVKMAMLLLDCRSDAGRKRTVSREFIAKAQSCLDTLRSKYWAEMGQGDRTLFYLASSDLEYRRSNYAETEKFACLAKDKAVEANHKLEASQAQERLNFVRAITGGDTIDNGPQQSESEGENADISSSGSESDWLSAILN